MLDLSQELYPNSPGLPDIPPPSMELLRNGPRDGWNLEVLTTPLHWGTHLDAPAHLADFSRTMDTYAVEELQGPAVVCDLRGRAPRTPITVADLEPTQPPPHSVVLLVTGWGAYVGWNRRWVLESPFLDPQAAAWLAGRGIRGVGIDHLSIGGMGSENRATHHALLGADIWIAENLSYPDALLDGGPWHVIALPVRIRAASGGPARVVALRWASESGPVTTPHG